MTNKNEYKEKNIRFLVFRLKLYLIKRIYLWYGFNETYDEVIKFFIEP